LEGTVPEATRCGGREAPCSGRSLARKTDRFFIACFRVSALPLIHEVEFAVITKPEEVKKIPRHLVKVGRGDAPWRRPTDPHPGWAPPAGSELRVISYLFPFLLRRSITSFGGYRVLQIDSLLIQDWGRLSRQRNCYWISVVQAVDACCRWLDRPRSYQICGVTAFLPITKIAINLSSGSCRDAVWYLQ